MLINALFDTDQIRRKNKRVTTLFDNKEITLNEKVDEEILIDSLYRERKIVDFLKYSKIAFSGGSDDFIDKKEVDELLMDIYHPNEITKLFFNNEIEETKQYFRKFSSGVRLENFIIILLKVLDVNIEHCPYLINGTREMFETIINGTQKKRITFADFINYYVNTQTSPKTIKNESEYNKKVLDNLNEFRFKVSNLQDHSHHENEIKTAQFSETLKLLVTLDDFSDHFSIFDENIKLVKSVQPNKTKHTIFPVLLLNIVISEKEKKIGATLQDFSLSFWSHGDNFIEEYTFFTNAMQLKILYIDSISGWITINSNNEIMKWDIAEGIGELVPLRFRGKISDIIEIKHLSLIAISSFDKKILFYDPINNRKFLNMKMTEGSAHTIRFSERNSLFFSSGFEKSVNIWQIDLTKDYSKLGRLDAGLRSSVSCIEVFDELNLLLTIDEKANMRSWEMESWTIIQTFKINTNRIASKIIRLNTYRFMVVAGRIHTFEFERKEKEVQNEDNPITNYMATIGYSMEDETIYVGCYSEIIIFGLNDGLVVNRYRGDNNTKRITKSFVLNQRNSTLMVADSIGGIKQLTKANLMENSQSKIFETKVKSLSSSEMFLGIEYDEANKIVVTWFTSTVAFYRIEEGSKLQFLRNVTLKGFEIVSILIVPKRDLLIVKLSNHLLIFFSYRHLSIYCEFALTEYTFTEIEAKPIGMTESISKYMIGKHDYMYKSIFLGKDKDSRKIQPFEILGVQFLGESKLLIVLDTNSSVYLFFLRNKNTKIVPFAKLDPNELLSANECFINMIKIHTLGSKYFWKTDVDDPMKLIHHGPDEEENPAIKAILKSSLGMIIYRAVQMVMEQEFRKAHTLKNYLTICESSGMIHLFDLQPFVEHHAALHSDKIRQMDLKNPFVKCNENYAKEFIEQRYLKALEYSTGTNDKNLRKTLAQLNLTPVSWKAHNSEIFEVKMVMHNEPLLITLSNNENLKIWSVKGILYGHLEFPKVERIFWRMNDLNRDRRGRRFDKTREIFNRLYRRMDHLNNPTNNFSKTLSSRKGDDKLESSLRNLKTLNIIRKPSRVNNQSPLNKQSISHVDINITSNSINEIAEKLRQKIANAESERSQNTNGETNNTKLNELLDKLNPKVHIMQMAERGTPKLKQLAKAMNGVYKTEENDCYKSIVKEEIQNVNSKEKDDGFDNSYKIFNRGYIKRAIETDEGIEEFSNHISSFRVNKFSPPSLRNYSPEFYRKNDERINRLTGKSPDYFQYLKEGHKFDKRARSGGNSAMSPNTTRELPDINESDSLSKARTTTTWRQNATLRKTILNNFTLNEITDEKKGKLVIERRKSIKKKQSDKEKEPGKQILNKLNKTFESALANKDK